MRAMILAAGRGERLRPLTDKLPKPLLSVAGKPIIEHLLDKLAHAGFHEIIINLAYLGDMIRDTLGDGSAWDLHIHYSEEPTGALDTGGGIYQALPLLGETAFAVINGDILTHYPLARLRALKCDNAHLVLVPNPEHNPHGDFSLQGGRVIPGAGPNAGSGGQAAGQAKYTFSGISVYHPRFFAGKSSGRFSVVPMLRSAIALQQVTGEVYKGVWHDIGTPERFATMGKIQSLNEV